MGHPKVIQRTTLPPAAPPGSRPRKNQPEPARPTADAASHLATGLAPRSRPWNPDPSPLPPRAIGESGWCRRLAPHHRRRDAGENNIAIGPISVVGYRRLGHFSENCHGDRDHPGPPSQHLREGADLLVGRYWCRGANPGRQIRTACHFGAGHLRIGRLPWMRKDHRQRLVSPTRQGDRQRGSRSIRHPIAQPPSASRHSRNCTRLRCSQKYQFSSNILSTTSPERATIGGVPVHRGRGITR